PTVVRALPTRRSSDLAELVPDDRDLLLRLLEQPLLLGRNDDVGHGDRNARLGRVGEAQFLDFVKDDRGLRRLVTAEALGDDRTRSEEHTSELQSRETL